MNTATPVDVYHVITNQIVADLDRVNPNDFVLPWHGANTRFLLQRNITSGQAYQGVNAVALCCVALNKGYRQAVWGTYRQWQADGRQVRKGEKASTIVFYKRLEPKEEAQAAPEDKRARMVAKASAVFAIEQTEGFVPPEIEAPRAAVGLVTRAETFLGAIGAIIRHEGVRAFYDRVADTITVPPRTSFIATKTSTNVEAYYSTVFHEQIHRTGHPARLNRDFGKRFGDKAYAAEELVAELGAAFLCAALEVSASPRLDHAQYLASWLTLLKEDPRALFVAASQAGQAVRWLRQQVDASVEDAAFDLLLGRPDPGAAVALTPEPR